MLLLFFVSSNINKFLEVKSILKDRLRGSRLNFYKFAITEIQSNDIEVIALEKAKSAYNNAKVPILIEDDGLFINSLNGFPGPYSSFIYNTIGNKGILQLMKRKTERTAFFKSIFVYNDGTHLKLFNGEVNGRISTKISDGGWGFDPIFIPEKSYISMGKMYVKEEKNKYSHRKIALEKFIPWYDSIQCED
ncbi:MAG: non-canonical purine NTP pyrophosphatase [Nitrososphaeraceae archaeon]